jgi:hypothetical protein
MPEIKSYADLIRDWVKLLAACRDNAAILGSIEPLRLALEDLLTRNQEAKSRQDALTAQRQAATQELEALKEEGREAARRLRGAVKSLVGSRSELLVHFNVAPLRKRGPRKVFVKQPVPPAPTVPATPLPPEVTAAATE